jgi:putative ABC transport system permease protein
VRDRIAQERFFARASIFFAAIGLALASIGLFALLSYNVSRRTREIGIRMALGANRGEVARMIVSQSLGLVAAGLAVGIPGAVVAGRSIAGSLYGLSPSDPPTILLSAVTMVVVCIVAATIPVRRATRVDPLIPLRYE